MFQPRNRLTEQDIREHLDTLGYCGASAKLRDVELVAIERPGWVQIYRFEGDATDSEETRRSFFGVLKDDQRSAAYPQISLFDTEQERRPLLQQHSRGLLTHERHPLGPFEIRLLRLFAAVATLAVISGMVRALITH